MDKIYDFCKTKNLLCKITNNTIGKNFLTQPSHSSKSIFENVKTEIDKLKVNIDPSYDPSIDPIIKKINDVYNDFLTNHDIDIFINEIYKIKGGLSSKNNIKSNIKKILKSNNKKENNVIINPLYNEPSFNKSSINLSRNFINDEFKNYIQLDILSQGKFINLSYPTLGIIKLNASGTLINARRLTEFTSLLQMFNELLVYIYGGLHNSKFIIPIQYTDIGKIICNILTNNNLDSISSIHEYINTVDTNMENIMLTTDKDKNGKKKNKKKKKYLNNKYIIPYEYDINNNSINLMKPSKFKKNSINYIQYFINERSLFDNIYIKLITETNKVLLNEIYKIMYLFCYRNIILFYDIYSYYINIKVNKYITSLKLSSNDIYKNLNYDEYFKYINNLNQSLLKLKTILLNNLYNIFKPNIIGKNYGISYIEDTFVSYIDENIIFTGNNIQQQLFFNQNYYGKDNNYNLFVNFNESDYYDKNNKLFIGVSLNNNEFLNSLLSIVNFDHTTLKSHKSTNIKILNLIIKILKNCIPIELLEQLTNKIAYFTSHGLSKKDKNNIKNYIITLFKNYLKKSTSYLMLMNSTNIKKHKMLILKSKINYNISYFIFRIVSTSMYDISVKNEIINEITSIKESYLDIIKKKLK